MTIYLYVKTHTITGLKYLGKTKKDPHTYPGSGVRWKRHLAKHGNDHTTEILRECQTNSELREWGLYYSNLWNVVESKEWANLAPESGDGGYRPNNHLATTYNKQPRPKEHAEKFYVEFRKYWDNRTGPGHRSKKVLINGTIYESYTDAAKQLNLSWQTIHNWVKLGKATQII